MIIDHLKEINRRTSYPLWNVGSSSNLPTGLSPQLVFPNLRSGDIRISEQEARILWCTSLQGMSYYFAVEAPTTETYIQTGQTGLSARIDISLYQILNKNLTRVANSEFKSGAPTNESIRKDLEKLIREKLPGNWFHLLTARNSGTFPSLSKKIVLAFNECKKIIKHNLDIVFCFCILSEKRTITQVLHYEHSNDNLDLYVAEFFSNMDEWPVIASM